MHGFELIMATPNESDVGCRLLLETWGLERYASNFEANEVDMDTLLLLDVHTSLDSVKELIPQVGPRIKFLAELQKLKSKDNNTQHANVSESGDATAVVPHPDNCLPEPSCARAIMSIERPRSTMASLPKKQKPAFDIRGILERCSGDVIIQDFESGLVSYKSRISAVRILVSHLITECGERPSSDVKISMAKAIIQEFPKLKDEDGAGYEAWFAPCSGRHCATGFLEDRLRNVRKRSAEHGKLRVNTTSQENTSLQSTTTIDFTMDVTEEEASTMLTWLKHNKEPLSQVKEFMAKTAKSRAHYISDHPEEGARKILQLFPRLVDVAGMIEQDFRIMLPDVADKLFLKWHKMSAGVIEYAEKQKNWRQYLKLPNEEPRGDEDVQNLACLVLPCILPTGTKKTKGKSSRSSTEEAMNSYLTFKPIGTNIPDLLEQTNMEQPFILILGESIVRPEQAFVIVERQAIPQASLLKAVDVCFKLFYVLDIAFPWQSLSTWEFFQKVVYGLGEGKGRDTTSGCVRSLRAFLINKETI